MFPRQEPGNAPTRLFVCSMTSDTNYWKEYRKKNKEKLAIKEKARQEARKLNRNANLVESRAKEKEYRKNASKESKTHRKAYRKRHHEEHKAHDNKRNAEYSKDHPDINGKAVVGYRTRNKERIRIKAIQKYHADPERAKKIARKSYQKNRDKHKQRWAEYSKKNRSRLQARNNLYRAMQMKAQVEIFTRDEIYDRDGGHCHVCGKYRQRDDWHMDHLVQLSLGGEHSRKNVAIACPECNIRRSNRGKAQLRLF